MTVPKLRFPEFWDAGKWEKSKLSEIAIFHKGKGISKADIDNNGEIPCVRYGELYTHYKEVINSIFSKTNLPKSELFIGCENDVLIPSSGETKLDIATASCLMADGVALGGDINVIRCDQNGIFMSYYLNSCKKFEIAKIAQGDTVVHLYSSQLKQLDMTLPSIDEQQKIADCLSSIDNLITAQTQKLDTLKTHKKGLMQQLFPAEGETLPKLRFPEFRGSWKKSALDRLIDFQSGCAFQSEYFSDQGEKLLTPKNFTKNGYASFNKGNTKYTVEDFDPKYVCKEGDLLLLLTDLTPSCELLGKPLLLTKDDGDVLLNQRIVRIIAKESVKTRFLFYFFLTESFHKRITDTATGSTVRHSSNRIISSTEIYFPLECEQQKIADCLSSIDNLITAQTQKIATLKLHKKGLMQQLFPSVEEVKG